MRFFAALALLAVACSGPGPQTVVPSAYPLPTQAAPIATPTTAPTQTVARVGAPIDLHRFALGPGTTNTPAAGAGLTLGTRSDREYWTSDWHEPAFAFTRLIPSWKAQTPEGTSVRIEAQGRRASGGETTYYAFADWTFGDGTFTRASVAGQRDADGYVDTDTLIAATPLTAYRIRVWLNRLEGTSVSPVLEAVAAVASDDATVRTAPASAHTGVVKDLAMPQLSQMIHRGEYPQWGSGGEAWCSPTSTLMVLKHWGRGPSKQDVAWVDPRYADPEVDHAARFTYDSEYGGTGNWSFNVAYAAQYGVNAFITQLRSLAEAERFIAAGIPLVASVKVAPGALPRFLLPEGSNGHLLVIRGFTEAGDVISNDPAANSNAEVRKVYPREAFERAWMGGSGGVVYVIHPPEIALPPHVDGVTPNW